MPSMYAATKPSGPVVTEGMDNGMADVDDPQPPSNRPFPLSQLDQKVLQQHTCLAYMYVIHEDELVSGLMTGLRGNDNVKNP